MRSQRQSLKQGLESVGQTPEALGCSLEQVYFWPLSNSSSRPGSASKTSSSLSAKANWCARAQDTKELRFDRSHLAPHRSASLRDARARPQSRAARFSHGGRTDSAMPSPSIHHKPENGCTITPPKLRFAVLQISRFLPLNKKAPAEAEAWF